MTITEAEQVLRNADLLADEAAVTLAIEQLGRQISTELAQSRPVVMCVMNGGLIFTGQLLTKLVFPLETAYVHATRYGDKTTGALLNWLYRPACDLRGRTVLLLDDILDEGVTLAAIAAWCREQGAEQVKIAVLVEKRHQRKFNPDFRADFVGIETEDRFLFGYGLDYRGYWRNAPGIYAVKGL